MVRRVLLLSIALAAVRGAPAQQPAVAAAVPRDEPVRGITISTHGSGRDWGTDAIVAAFREVKDLGANWVAVHPYAWIRDDGRVGFRAFDAGAPPEHVVRPIREARKLGLKILVKPHLGYWSSRFSWRGDIAFGDDAEWRRFWRGYRAWIAALAEVCGGADAFAVGTELDRTLGHEGEWRALVAETRKRLDCPLTYAANWTDYEKVGFWDALDAVGVQAYFPLTERPTSSEELIRAGWDARMRELRAFAEATGRRIVFTELGYDCSHLAPVKPWEARRDGPEAAAVQRLCTRVALEAVERERAIVGAFLWKWFPPPRRVGRDFQLARPDMRAVIRASWKR